MIRRRTLVLSILLLLGLLGFHTLVQREVHGAGVQKIEWTAQWKAPLPGVRAMSAGPDGVLVIGERAIALLGADGSVARRHDRKAIVIGSTGDLDGNGTEEIVVAGEGPAPTIEALDRSLAPLWAVALPAGAAPAARLLVGDLDGDGRREVVVGAGTTLYAFSGAGRPLWKLDVLPEGPRGADDVMRGLDDARAVKDGKKTRHVAFALQSGLFGLIGGDGVLGWTKKGDRLRRLRVVDLDGDGSSEVVTGLEGGSVGIWDIAGKSV
ncbi:MAG TPA: FG-GAP-like repeat-containing protein, partial [Vicinamibacteria bacterium]